MVRAVVLYDSDPHTYSVKAAVLNINGVAYHAVDDANVVLVVNVPVTLVLEANVSPGVPIPVLTADAVTEIAVPVRLPEPAAVISIVFVSFTESV